MNPLLEKYIAGDVHDRFLASFKKDKNGCWTWVRGATNGYGYFNHRGTTERAHRYSYKFYKGEIPEGLVIDHLCRNKLCVNPEHLEAVTNRENVVIRGTGPLHVSFMKTHCIRGHRLAGKNIKIQIRKDGSRCRLCQTCKRFFLKRHNDSIRKRPVGSLSHLCKPVLLRTLDGKAYKSFPSATECSRFLGLKDGAVSGHIKGSSATVQNGKYKAEYLTEAEYLALKEPNIK